MAAVAQLEQEDPRRKVIQVHKGQRLALEATSRIVLVLAGSGGGKTTIGPAWLVREVQKYWALPAEQQRYLVAAPTTTLTRVAFDLLTPYLKLLGDPRIGEGHDGWKASERTWYLRSGGFVRFASIDNPGVIEGVHYRAAWLDEWGQVDDYQHNTAMRRLALYEGRAFITTTPYPEFAGASTKRTWVSALMQRSRDGDTDVTVIQFPSWWNPAFPKAEIEHLRLTYQPWEFAMFVEGLLSRPQGVIYGLWSELEHVIVPIPLETPTYRVKPRAKVVELRSSAVPVGDDSVLARQAHRCDMLATGAECDLGETCDCRCASCTAAPAVADPWPVFSGMDFGGTNPACILWAALSPEDVLYVFAERYAPNKTMGSHIAALSGRRPNEEVPGPFDGTGTGPLPLRPETLWGDPSAKVSLLDLREANVRAIAAENDVEEGIREVYERLATRRLYVFRGRAPNLVREIGQYRRGDNGKPVKEDDHAVDALRYLCMGLKRSQRTSRLSHGFA